jgi:t-SNARE complex subunit (syntaxin)
VSTEGDVREQAVAAAKRLIAKSPNGETTGEDVARELGISDDAEGRKVLADALMDANEKGDLRADFPGGMELPYRIMEES